MKPLSKIFGGWLLGIVIAFLIFCLVGRCGMHGPHQMWRIPWLATRLEASPMAALRCSAG